MTRNEHTRFITRPNIRTKEKNKTTLFMLPALDFTNGKISTQVLKHFGFVNCYIDHTDTYNKVPDCLYMVFNPDKEVMKDFSKFFELYKTYSNFIDDYPVDKNLIVVIFKIKNKWKASYEEFKKSNYSKMSLEYAELFKRPDRHTGKVNVATEYFIIYKHKSYKEFLEKFLDVQIEDSAELMDRLNYDKEIFNYERKDTKPELIEI